MGSLQAKNSQWHTLDEGLGFLAPLAAAAPSRQHSHPVEATTPPAPLPTHTHSSSAGSGLQASLIPPPLTVKAALQHLLTETLGLRNVSAQSHNPPKDTEGLESGATSEALVLCTGVQIQQGTHSPSSRGLQTVSSQWAERF